LQFFLLAPWPGGREARAGDLRAPAGAGRSQAGQRCRHGRSPPTGTVAAHSFEPLSGRSASLLDDDGGVWSGSVAQVAHVGVPDPVLDTLADAVAHGRRELAGGWRGGRRDRRQRPAGGHLMRAARSRKSRRIGCRHGGCSSGTAGTTRGHRHFLRSSAPWRWPPRTNPLARGYRRAARYHPCYCWGARALCGSRPVSGYRWCA
jgi:hypothetical protein